MAKEMISFAKAKLAATTRLPLRTERQIEKRLDQWQLTSAEAFIQGAEEAQREFIRRINLLRPTAATKPATWFDGGYLGNGHCSFMWARNGEGACCRLPHGHEGPHVADSQSDRPGGE
jgi:hypothetical protein